MPEKQFPWDGSDSRAPDHSYQVIRGLRLADQVGCMADDDLAELAIEAYLYGFPLVFNLDQ
jgi:hypothetical protein